MAGTIEKTDSRHPSHAQHFNVLDARIRGIKLHIASIQKESEKASDEVKKFNEARIASLQNDLKSLESAKPKAVKVEEKTEEPKKDK